MEVVHQCRPHGKGGVERSPWVDHDWCGFSQALQKGIEGEDWRDLYDACKEMCKAVRRLGSHRRPRKQKPFGKGRQPDAGEEYDDPEREDNILERRTL